MTADAINFDLLRQRVHALNGDSLSDLRSNALRQFEQSGFPTRRHEDWKYTSLQAAIAASNDWLANDVSDRAINGAAGPATEEIDACWITLRNGVVDYSPNQLPNGVEIVRLSSTATDDLGASDAALTHFNTALLNDGIVVRIAAGADVATPIGFSVEGHADDAAVVAQNRVLVDAQAGSKFAIVEALHSSGSHDCFMNCVYQVAMAADSSIDWVRIQQCARNHIHIGTMHTDLQRSAALRYATYDIGGKLIRNDTIAELSGTDADVTLDGLFLAGDHQHIDNHTRIDHRVGPSRSAEHYRGILNRKARAVFNGKAIVHKGADGSNAEQSNHNLLLSAEAEIDTKPELEIYADDVKCSHGATVGQLDEPALFYLRSRGIDEPTATQILTHAFAAGVAGANPVAAASDYVHSLLETRLRSLIGDQPDV